MKCKQPTHWQLTSEEDWFRMLLGRVYKQLKEMQTTNQFLPDKITLMYNKYERDRVEILKNNDHYSQGVTETLEANDHLIIKEGKRLRGLQSQPTTGR